MVAAVFVGLLALSVALASEPSGAASSAQSVVVDLGATRQRISGFGTSTRVWSDPHLAKSGNVYVPPEGQREVLAAIQRVGLTRIRPVLDTGVQKQPGGPFDFSGKLGDDHVAFVKQARAYGMRVAFPGPVYLEGWMRADDPGSYVEWALRMLLRFREKGVELALYAPLNEPEIAGDFPPEWLRQVVVQLGRRMRSVGLDTKLVVPDDENPVDAYERAAAVLSDPEARRYVGAVAFHIYRNVNPTTLTRLRRLATAYGLELWMTEYNSKTYTDWRSSVDWGVKMHELLTVGSVNAIDYLFAFFGNWVGDTTLVRMDFENGRYRGYGLTSLYWITGQYSRFVRPGDVRVAATPASGEVLVSAYRGRGRVTVVAINPSSRQQALRARIVRGGVSRFVAHVRSSASERWRALPPPRLLGSRFAATLPPESITTFVLAR